MKGYMMEPKTYTTVTEAIEGVLHTLEDNIETQRNLVDAVHMIRLALERIDVQLDDMLSRIKALEKTK